MTYNHVHEIRGLWEGIKIEMDQQSESGHENFNSIPINTSLEWLAKKQRDFSGDSYFEQIEKNAIYLSECAHQVICETARHLVKGDPPNPQEIPAIQDSLRAHAIEENSYHLNFIRNGCNSCPVHQDHGRWQKLATIRSTANRRDYIDELEFTCIYKQMELLIAQMFLNVFLHNPQFAGIAKQLPESEVLTTLQERCYMTVAAWGNLISPASDPVSAGDGDKTRSIHWKEEPLGTPPKWRHIWGKEFEAVARRVGN